MEKVKTYCVKKSNIRAKVNKERRKSTWERDKKFRNTSQKVKSLEKVKEKIVVAMDFSSKKQKLNANSDQSSHQI